VFYFLKHSAWIFHQHFKDFKSLDSFISSFNEWLKIVFKSTVMLNLSSSFWSQKVLKQIKRQFISENFFFNICLTPWRCQQFLWLFKWLKHVICVYWDQIQVWTEFKHKRTFKIFLYHGVFEFRIILTKWRWKQPMIVQINTCYELLLKTNLYLWRIKTQADNYSIKNFCMGFFNLNYSIFTL
jgi:hypothetical protein